MRFPEETYLNLCILFVAYYVCSNAGIYALPEKETLAEYSAHVRLHGILAMLAELCRLLVMPSL